MLLTTLEYTFWRWGRFTFVSWVFLLGSIGCLIGSGISFSNGCMDNFFCPKFSITHTSVANITAISLNSDGGINAFVPLIEFESNCLWFINKQNGLKFYISPSDAMKAGGTYYSIGESVSVLNQNNENENENENECIPLFYTKQYGNAVIGLMLFSFSLFQMILLFIILYEKYSITKWLRPFPVYPLVT